MSDSILKIALALAYGPFGLMILLYLTALSIRLAGDDTLLRLLITRTSVPAPIPRPAHDEEEDD